MDSETAKLFLNKTVGVLFRDSGEDVYIKGKLVAVNMDSLLLSGFRGQTAISLKDVKKIKEAGYA